MKKLLMGVVGLSLLAPVLWAEPVSTGKKRMFDGFIRTIEVEGGVGSTGSNDQGAQFGRLETRYLDPEINAFVGLLVLGTRFNEKLRLADSNDPYVSRTIFNWGAAIGVQRGRHLWAVDLMGVNIGHHLGFGPAFVGEHTLGAGFKLYHRTAVDFFDGDTVLDSDQGVTWYPANWVGFTAGYRIFTASHTNRNGPRASIIFRFESPKLPFIFPSIG